MNRKIKSLLRRVLRGQDAQVIPITAFLMVGFLGMTAAVIDVGDVYYGYNELMASTNAAALAGAEAISNPGLGSPSTVAAGYSSEPGGLNTHAIFNDMHGQNTATITADTPVCNSFVSNTLGISCVTYDGAGTANAIQVTQTAKVRTYFAALFGHPTIALSATASAARSGGNGPPYNVAIIVDTTESMTSTDKDSECDNTRIACSLQGIEVLLKNLAPCSSTSTCSISDGVAANSVDRVALFTFPNIYTNTTSDDYTCPTSEPTIEPYTFPSSTESSSGYTYTAATVGKNTYDATYEITLGLGGTDGNGFLSDYKASDSTQTLNTASDLVVATGGSTDKNCGGVEAPGGAGTYYAGVIYAAQSTLDAEKLANSGSQNVIILVSDGDADSTGTGTFNKITDVNKMGTASTTSGTYPSTVDECSQAITAAKYAASVGTRVYAVAYGTESSGCATDTSTKETYDNIKDITPCQTMAAIASDSSYFYSDYGDSQSGNTNTCATSGEPTTSLDQIFQDISADFFVSRLIPNNAFSGS